MVSAPARRALENNGINTLQDLSKYSEGELLSLHGLGKSSIPKLKKALMDNGFALRQP
jgi:DNA-directed RNA polymerase alpha subunit